MRSSADRHANLDHEIHVDMLPDRHAGLEHEIHVDMLADRHAGLEHEVECASPPTRLAASMLHVQHKKRTEAGI